MLSVMCLSVSVNSSVPIDLEAFFDALALHCLRLTAIEFQADNEIVLSPTETFIFKLIFTYSYLNAATAVTCDSHSHMHYRGRGGFRWCEGGPGGSEKFSPRNEYDEEYSKFSN